MITNIVAAVTVALATNVTERFPQHLVSDNHIWSSNNIGDAVFYGRWETVPNPKEKWVTTNVVEVHSLNLIWDGYKCEEFYDVPVTNWSTHFEKLDSWTRSATNSPPPNSWTESIH